MTQISNGCISASFYRLASLKIYVRHQMWNFQQMLKFLSFLVYLNQKWHFWLICNIYILYTGFNAFLKYVKLPNFKTFFSWVTQVVIVSIRLNHQMMKHWLKHYFLPWKWENMAFFIKMAKFALKTRTFSQNELAQRIFILSWDYKCMLGGNK